MRKHLVRVFCACPAFRLKIGIYGGLSVLLSVCYLLTKAPPVHAAVPKMLNYQGRLTDEDDALYDGTTVYMKFDVFDAVTAGNELWSSDEDNGGGNETCGVEVTPSGGVFNIAIGDTALSWMADLDIDFNTDAYYLEIKIQESAFCPAAEGDYETLTPRQRILSSGYSINADTVDGANADSTPVASEIPILDAGGDLVLGSAASNDDDIIFFDDGAGEYIMWDDSPGEFVISDSLNLFDDLKIGTLASNDDDIIYFDDGSAEYIMWDESDGDFFVSDDFSVDGDLEVIGADITLHTAGVKLTGDDDGAITFLGLGDGADEDLTMNLDDTANQVVFSSSTGVTIADFGTIDLGTDALDVSDGNITNVGDIALDTISSDAGLAVTVVLGGGAGDDFIVDTDVLVVESDTNRVGIGTTGPGALLDVDGDAIFNESGADKDFRIEGLLDQNLFFLDASADYIGIGDSTPDHKLDVAGNIGLDAGGYINWDDTDGTSGYGFRDNSGTLQYKDSGGSWAGLGGTSLWTDGGDFLYPAGKEAILVYDSGGTDYIKIAHDGTDANIITQNTGEINIDNDLDIALNLKVGSSASDDDDYIYFDDGSTESLMWDNSGHSYIAGGAGFVLSDDLEIQGNIVKYDSLYINAAGPSSEIVFQTGGTDKLTIETSGALDDSYLAAGVPLSETNVTGLSSAFTATSIIGALNELKGGGGFKYLPIICEGNAVDEDTFFDGFTPDQNIVITKVTISARTAPTDADLQIDLLKDSAEQSVIATLTAASNYETTDITDTTITSSETLGLIIKQIGSTLAGEDITVVLHYKEPTGGGGSSYINIFYEGTAQDEDTFFEGHFFDSPVTITEIDIAARTAPTGANLEIDVLEDGAEQLASNPQLTAGSTFENNDISDLSFDRADRLGLIIKQIGSTVAGESLNVILHYTEDQGDVGRQYLMLPNIALAEDENDYFDGLSFDSSTTVSQIGLFARTGPAGSALTVDLLKDGSEESRTTTLRDGGTYQLTNITDDSYTTAHRLGLRIKSIGSTTAGASVLTVLHLGQGPSLNTGSSSGANLDDRLIIGSGDWNNLSGFSFGQNDLYVSGDIGVSGTAYLEGGTAWTAADIAEMYPTLDKSLEAGDLVSTEATASGYIKKSEVSYDSGLLGAVSTDPAGVLGYKTEDSVPVALIGRVPVKVSNINGPIKIGDSITSSSLPGIGMKATGIGVVVGKALEPFDPENGVGTAESCPEIGNSATCGRIMVFVNVSWYDPSLVIAENGKLTDMESTRIKQIITDKTDDTNVSAWLKERLASVVGSVRVFQNVVAGRIITPLLESRKVVTKLALLEETKTDIISPLSDGRLVIRLGQGDTSEVKSLSFETSVKEDSDTSEVDGFGGVLEIQNKEGEPVVTIDSFGNLTASGSGTFKELTAYEIIRSRTIEAENIRIYSDSSPVFEVDNLGNVTASGSATFNEITAYEIIRARKIVADGIEALGKSKFGELVAQKITVENLDVTNKEQLVELISQVLEEGPEDTSEVKSLSSETSVKEDSDTSEVEEEMKQLISELSSRFDELEKEITTTALEVQRGTFTETLQVLGSTSLAATTIAGPLSQDGTLLFTEGKNIDVIGDALYLQSEGLGAIDFIAGAMKLDEEGNLIVSGQLTVAKGLFTDKIAPASGDKLVLEGDIEATGSARFGDLIEADRASFGSLLTKTIDSETVTAETISTDTLQVSEYAQIKDLILDGKIRFSTEGPDRSAGVETILAGTRAAVVSTSLIEEDSYVFLTPQSSTTQTLYVSEKVPGAYFVVSLDDPVPTNLDFAWLLLN